MTIAPVSWVPRCHGCPGVMGAPVSWRRCVLVDPTAVQTGAGERLNRACTCRIGLRYEPHLYWLDGWSNEIVQQ